MKDGKIVEKKQQGQPEIFVSFSISEAVYVQKSKLAVLVCNVNPPQYGRWGLQNGFSDKQKQET